VGVSVFDEKIAYVFGKGFLINQLASHTELFPGAPQNLRIDRLVATTDDTIDHEITLWINNDGNPVPVGTVHLPAGSGFSAAIPPVDLIAALPALGDGVNFYNGGSFHVSDPVAITALKFIYFAVIGAWM